jgi:hypothetical protein
MFLRLLGAQDDEDTLEVGVLGDQFVLLEPDAA